jgi:aminoglycoside phosphotransferase (APT) family kinase protein
MLVEEMPGRIIGHMFALPPPNRALCTDTAVQLARLHRIPVGEFGSHTESAGLTNQEKATRWLNESYTSFKALDRPSPIIETAFHWLRDRIALNDGARSLVHGDYGLNNLLVQRPGQRDPRLGICAHRGAICGLGTSALGRAPRSWEFLIHAISGCGWLCTDR